jgi:hypothetical protein
MSLASNVAIKLSDVLAIVPNTARLMTVLKFMEKSLLPTEYCIKEVTNELMKTATPQHVINIHQRYANWIQKHHITYAAVLNNREDLMMYYDEYIDKNTLVHPAIRSGNKSIFKRVFNDTMGLLDKLGDQDDENKKHKINIKQNLTSWLESVMSAGSYDILEIMLPKAKLILPDVGDMLTRRLIDVPKKSLVKIMNTIHAHGVFDPTKGTIHYHNAAIMRNLRHIVDNLSLQQLSVVDPKCVGRSLNKTILDRYLPLIMSYTDHTILISLLLNGALQSRKEDYRHEFIMYMLSKFNIAPNLITITLDKTLTLASTLALVNAGFNVVISGDYDTYNARFAHLINNGVMIEKILNLLQIATTRDYIVIGNEFIDALCNKGHQTLVYVLSRVVDINKLRVEITTAGCLELLKMYPVVKPILTTLIELRKLDITDNIWGTNHNQPIHAVDSRKFNVLINNMVEKYLLGVVGLWIQHGILVNSDDIVSAALYCDFSYFGEHSQVMLAAVKYLVAPLMDAQTARLLNNTCYAQRAYRYQSYLHNAHPEIVIEVFKCGKPDHHFALKLALENPDTFSEVFKYIPESQHHALFILSGCLLRTRVFKIVFYRLKAANKLPDKPTLHRAFTLFASHGKDTTIKFIISQLRIRVHLRDIALLTLQDRSEHIELMVQGVCARYSYNYTSIVYLMAAYRRKTQFIIKLSELGLPYKKLDIPALHKLIIPEENYVERDLENKITNYNQVLLELIQKSKLLNDLNEYVLTTLKLISN